MFSVFSFQFSVSITISSIQTDPKFSVQNALPMSASAYVFVCLSFFFQAMIVDFLCEQCILVDSVHCLWDSQISIFSSFFIKYNYYGTIYIFKNYFTKILYPNDPRSKNQVVNKSCVTLVVDLGRTPKLFILLQLQTFYPKEYYQKNGGHPSEPKFSPRCFGLW